MEARLLNDSRIMATDSKNLGPAVLEFNLRIPAEGARNLIIRHHLDSTDVDHRVSVVAIEILPGTDRATLRRARMMLACISRIPPCDAMAALRMKKFGLRPRDSWRTALAICSGDTVTFDVSPTDSGKYLRFWATSLRARASSKSTLVIEGLIGDTWLSLDQREESNLDEYVWYRHDISLLSKPRGVRFLMTGKNDVVAVGSPVILSDT